MKLLFTAFLTLISLSKAAEVPDPSFTPSNQIPYDDLEPSEHPAGDPAVLHVPAADPHRHHLHCITLTTPTAAAYVYKLRAYTVRDWPLTGPSRETYPVKALGVQPIGICDDNDGHTDRGPNHENAPHCRFHPNGGDKGRVDLDYKYTEKGITYEACAGGALHGYYLVFMSYYKQANGHYHQ